MSSSSTTSRSFVSSSFHFVTDKLIKWPFIAYWIFLNELASTIHWLFYEVFLNSLVIPLLAFIAPSFTYRYFLAKVQLNSGVAIGRRYSGYTKFEAIQYAKAERFQPPRKLSENNHSDRRVLNVKPTCFPQNLTPLNFDRFPFLRSSVENFSSYCSQGYLGSEEIGHQLNIWTPSSFSTNEKLRPVLVVFHGGAYIFSSAHQSFIDGTSWAQQYDYVVVAANWRLALPGFLFHPEMDQSQLTANCGILDAIFVLRWVRENIHKFGGDCNSVTISGQSAGAMLCSKLCSIKHVVEEKLFHRTVMMSGGSQLVLTPKVASQIYFETAIATGFIDDNHSNILSSPAEQKAFDHKAFASYLRSLPTKKIVQAQGKVILSCLKDYFTCNRGYITPFAPCVDGKLILKNPVKQMEENGLSVPTFLGSTESECTLFTDIRRRKYETENEKEERLKRRIRSWFTETTECALKPAEHDHLIEKLFAAYRKGKYQKRLVNTADVSWIALNTDFAFRVPIENFANVMARNHRANNHRNEKSSSSSSNIFMYCFSNPSLIARLGAPHVADLPYFFDVLRCAQPVSGLWTPARVALKNKMMTDLDNFMRGRYEKLWTPWSEEERPVYFYDSREPMMTVDSAKKDDDDGGENQSSSETARDDTKTSSTKDEYYYYSGLVLRPDHDEVQAWKPLSDLFIDLV